MMTLDEARDFARLCNVMAGRSRSVYTYVQESRSRDVDDTIVFKGKTGEHSLALESTDATRAWEHWKGFARANGLNW